MSVIKSLDLNNGHYFFNIGVNKGMSIYDLAKKIAKQLEWGGEFKLNESMPDGAEEKRVVGKFMEENFNWSPEVSIDKGIELTVKWYKENVG